MHKLVNLVADYIERRLLQPARLEEILSSVLHRREERAERRATHIAELRKRVTEADAKLKRLYDAIENGIADLSDSMLKDRITELKAIRDQAHADAERAQEASQRVGPSVTLQALKTFARQVRKRMRSENGGYRRDHLRALAQRIEVEAKEVRIMGSKSELPRTLVAASNAKTAGFGVPSSVSILAYRIGFEPVTSAFGRDHACDVHRRVTAKLAGARRVFRRAPLTHQPACKPGFVGRNALARAARDGHSSATPVARRLEQPTRTAGSGHRSRRFLPAFAGRGSAPSLFGLAPGGVCRAASVAAGAVRSYRTVSPLPRRYATCRGGLFSVALSLGSRPPDVIRHRTSMEPGLSSPAAFRPLPERPSGRLTF